MFSKKLFVVLFLSLFLVACIKVETNQTTPNISVQKKINMLSENNSNISQPKIMNVTKKMINGTERTIEVMDVAEDGSACLIRVNGVIMLIKEGETKTINGVKIFLSDVKLMHSQLQNNDACQLVIA